MRSRAKDMTTGRAGEQIFWFTLPLLAGNLLQQMYNIVDTMIVGKYLGGSAIAAIGATGSITYLFYTLCLGLATGAGILISQSFGERNEDKMKTAITNSAYVILFFGVLVSLLSCFLAREILQALGTPQSLLPQATAYMKITCGGTIAIALYNWINAALRAIGDSKTPLLFLGVASILNVGLDLLFVLGFHMGVTGAAWATVIAQGLSGLLSIGYAWIRNENFSFQKKHYLFHWEIAKRCVGMGVPIALQNGLISVSMVALQQVTNSFGEMVMAAYTVTMRVEQFIQQPFASLNIAVSTFVGQNTGAGQASRAKKGYKVAAKFSSLLAIAVMAIFWVSAEGILRCFVSEPEVIRLGAAAMRITATCYLFLGLIHTTRGFLNGIGDTNYALINGLAEVICRIGFSVVLTRIPVIGCWGIWLTTCITWVATAGVSLIRYVQKTGQNESMVN